MDCNSFPGLKRTAFPGGMLTSAPVRGLRPMPVFRGRTLNTPNPRSSIRSTFARAPFMLSKTVSTACSAFVLVMPVLVTTSLMISSLIIGFLDWLSQTADTKGDMRHCQFYVRNLNMGSLPKIFHPPRNPMAIKSDKWIRRMALEHDMINPFTEKQVRQGVISYGLSSYGYDLRVSDEFKVFTNVNSTIVDPKNFDERSFVSMNCECALIPPNSFA